jgi:hypothetical protein
MPSVGQLVCGVLAVAIGVEVLAGGVSFGPVGLYQVVATTAMVVAWVSLFRAAPQRPWAWRWLLSGFSAWVAGDVVYFVEIDVLDLGVFPAWSDALYLLGYVFLATGTLRLARTREAGRDRTAVLDAVIVAVGVAVPTWVFLVEPAAADSELGLAGRLTSSAYPLLDLFLIAVLTRLLATPGAKTGAFRRLAWALVLTLGGGRGLQRRRGDLRTGLRQLVDGRRVAGELCPGGRRHLPPVHDVGHREAAAARPDPHCLPAGRPRRRLDPARPSPSPQTAGPTTRWRGRRWRSGPQRCRCWSSPGWRACWTRSRSRPCSCRRWPASTA